jgi:phage baseplate assembly protein V
MKSVAALPGLAVTMGDAELSTTDADALTTVRVRQALQVPAQCELVFLGPADNLIARATDLPGKPLRLGVDGGALFQGEITAVELSYGADRERHLSIRAYDLLHRLRKHRPVRRFSEVSVKDLAEQFAGPCELDVDCPNAGPAWPQLMQWNQSDLDLLASTAARAGLYFAAVDDTLRVFTLEGWGDPVSLALGDTLFEARFELNGEYAIDSVHAYAWDPLSGKRFDAEQTTPRRGRDVTGDVAADALGADGDCTLCALALPDSGQTEAAAQAVLDRAAAARADLTGVAHGDPALRPGVRVDVAGVAAAFAGTYVVTEVTHTVDADHGYLATFSSRPPLPRQAPPSGAVVTPGVVTRVDDPDGLGRVQANLPLYPSLTTSWMRVVMPAAGKDKGFVSLPDVDDEVLVIMPGADPAMGVVLGGLYNVAPPDAGVAHEAVRRYTWRTPGGQQVQLDDDKKTIALKNQDGTALTLAPEKVQLHAVTDLEIEAPGHRITIRAANVDFRKG